MHLADREGKCLANPANLDHPCLPGMLHGSRPSINRCFASTEGLPIWIVAGGPARSPRILDSRLAVT